MTTEKIYGPWVKCDGVKRPVPPDTMMEMRFRCGVVKQAYAKKYYWQHRNGGGDIVEYRTVTEQLAS